MTVVKKAVKNSAVSSNKSNRVEIHDSASVSQMTKFSIKSSVTHSAATAKIKSPVKRNNNNPSVKSSNRKELTPKKEPKLVYNPQQQQLQKRLEIAQRYTLHKQLAA